MKPRNWHPIRAAGVLLVLLLAGCGADSSTPASAPASPAPASTIETGTSPPAAEEVCDEPAFLPVLKDAFDDETRPVPLRIVGVEVKRCLDSYAQVFAVPDESVCPPATGPCIEHEQVLLRSTGGSWRILTSGTGLACEEPGFETIPVIRSACRGLGYPGY